MNPTTPAPVKRRMATMRRSMLDHDMRPDDGRILVAVSGGPDSTALLLLLHRLGKTMRLDLHVAHFDHGLRGRELADAEERFVRSLCESLEVPLTTGASDVREAARKRRLSLEDAARRERYAFLARIASGLGFHAVATGHTASDQGETVLLHLIRGAGLEGLAGIAPVSAWPFPGHEGLKLLRPILDLSRNDTRAVCTELGVEALVDESNASPRFRRNRIRHEVLPLLREMNPRVDDALARLARNASEDVSFMGALGRSLVAGRGSEQRTIYRKAAAGSPLALTRRAIRHALNLVAGGSNDFTQRHYDTVDRLLMRGATGDHLDLPHGLTADLTSDAIVIARPQPEAIRLPENGVTLRPGERIGFGPVYVALSASKPGSGLWVEVDAESVEAGVTVRRRREGDRFQPLGMAGTKKLQDFFVDSRIPRAERDNVPIFESERGIVWVGGLRVADWAKPRSGAPTLFLSFEPLTD